MLTKTEYRIDPNLLKLAFDSIPRFDFKFTVNEPTGRFFYDTWKLKKEFEGTVWEDIYNSLPFDKGEARIIQLNPAETYAAHADIDDRYHLNIAGNNSYLIDLEKLVMHKLIQDGIWYYMKAGNLHTASNFGNRHRYQLVIRKLLQESTKENLVRVKIIPNTTDLENARFEFDNSFSPILNELDKTNNLKDFELEDNHITFSITSDCVSKIRSISNNLFQVIV